MTNNNKSIYTKSKISDIINSGSVNSWFEILSKPREVLRSLNRTLDRELNEVSKTEFLIKRFEEEVIKEAIKHEIYAPVEKLLEYKNRKLYEITVVLDTKEIKTFKDWDTIGVTNKGHLSCSDHEKGFYTFDTGLGCYTEVAHNAILSMDKIIGFYNLHTYKGKVREFSFETILVKLGEIYDRLI